MVPIDTPIFYYHFQSFFAFFLSSYRKVKLINIKKMENQGDIEIKILDESNLQNGKEYSTNNGFELPISLAQFGYPQAQVWIQHRKAILRPWNVFLNTNNIKAPPSLARLSKRVMKNIEYFQSNYLFVFIGLVIYCLITSPLLLITVVASLATCYKVSQRHSRQELKIFNQKLTLAQAYIIVAVCSLPLFYLVGAGAVLFWVFGVSWFLITIHAAFYNIDSILCPGEDELNSLMMQQV